MDWAGTAIDYGCFAPVAAFVNSFKAIGAPVTPEETRQHMGLTKIEEIRTLFAIPHVAADFRKENGHDCSEADVQNCYEHFQKALFTTLVSYAVPIPDVVETVAKLRADGIKVGSTTGYTRPMMDIVMPAAANLGYAVDHCATADGKPGGRPKPYMIYENLCRLDVSCRRSAIKVGDTIADIREGVNAGTWSVGVLLGSNELGLTQQETAAMAPAELSSRMAGARWNMLAAGADYVIDSIAQLPQLIKCVNERMALD